jgi:hypothetical protein
MRVAEQLRKTNIAEYLLYMWQVEDLLRANHCDMDRVRQNILPAFAEADRAAEDKWLSELCNMMLTEGVTERGHLQINKNVLSELTDLHLALLASPKFPFYSAAYYNALPFIVELRGKEGDEVLPEIETCFNALYGELMLKLQKKPIGEETQRALQSISKVVAMLAQYYADERSGKLKMNDDDTE